MNELLIQLADVFDRHGHTLFLVGGAVRDQILNQCDPQDADCATSAPPSEIKRLIQEVRPDSVYTMGEKFGTIGMIRGGHQIEITTYRGEHYVEASRKPEVHFGVSLHDDLSRRDFTINAMARDPRAGEIVDPFGGQADLTSRVIRAVGQPADRFHEDPLRMLRAVRFMVQLDFELEQATAEAIKREAPSLASISKERIAAEFNRILRSRRPSRGVRTLVALGLMGDIAPEVLDMRGVSQRPMHHKDVFEHTMMVLEGTHDELRLRWAALLHDVAKPRTKSVENGAVHFYGHEVVGEQMARKVLARLRLDQHLIQSVGRLVGLHMRANSYEANWTDGAVRRIIREAGEELWDLLALSRADITSYRPEKILRGVNRVREMEQRCQELLTREEVAKLDSPLNGHDLMELFQRPPGPWIGRIKQRLLDLVLDGELGQNDRERATELARQFILEDEHHA